MKRAYIAVLLMVVAIVIFLQFIPRTYNEGSQAGSKSLTAVYKVPENVQAILQTSCYDCHSNHTKYPWYARIQPVRYILDRHVRDGKEELNFDEFGKYSVRKKRNKLRGIENSLKEGTMPLSSYLWIHRKAKLSQQEKSELLNWINGIPEEE